MASGEKNLLMDFARRVLFEYWQTENSMIDYFLIDYCIAVGYDTIPAIKQMIDSVPETDANPHDLQLRLGLNNPLDPLQFELLLKRTSYHKLKFKGLKKYTDNGKLTYFGYIISLEGVI
jgi:hypothetical protein